MKNDIAILWMKNAIIALAIAGLYSVILVMLRTPVLTSLFADKSMFKSALVVHVNLSVLVWLLSMSCVIWSYSYIRTGFEKTFSYIAFIAMIFMGISPFFLDTIPVMNNYIPMLENLFFIIGLVLFLIVILFFSIQTVATSYMSCNLVNYGSRIIAIVKFTSAFMFICAWICFILSFFGVNEIIKIVPLDIDIFYEMLFWSGGHLLQFIYTQMLMFVLLILAECQMGGRVKNTSVYEMLFSLNFILSLAVFIGHYNYDMENPAFKEFYTLHMIYCAGLAPTIFIAILLYEIVFFRLKSVTKYPVSFVKSTFIASSLLFLSGGLIGVVISGVNVTIPAHYHGSIVGISIGFMGLAYILCFQNSILKSLREKNGAIGHLISFDSKKPNYAPKAASWQIIILTFGQILHIVGLALAGGYGVLRKTPGVEIPLLAKIYMGMVGVGGLIAIIGGLIFVYICAKNLYDFNSTKHKS